MAVLQYLDEFLKDYVQHAGKAYARVYLQSMIIGDGKAFGEIEQAMLSAKRNGADVRINIDWVYSRYYNGNIDVIPQFLNAKHTEYLLHQTENAAMLERLINERISVHILNPPRLLNFILPITGRNHMKLYIADSTAWIGGLNLYDKSFKYADFMVKHTDLRVVNALIHLFLKMGKHTLEKDYARKLNETDTLLVDCGYRNSSIILDAAIEEVSRAKKQVLMMSQMMPEGRLLDTMIELSERNTPVTIVTSSKRNSMFKTFPNNIPFNQFLLKTLGKKNITLIHLNKKVHAKLILVDGEVALYGSHNFVDTGVRLGTAEIAMKTTDKRLIKQLDKFAAQYI